MPARLLEKTYDELAVGDRETSRGRTITEADVVAFCTLTGDMFVLHTNRVYAERTMFGQRIAPGMLTLAYSYGLGIPAESATVLANYGSDQLRFPAPVFIGDTLTLEIEVLEKKDRDAKTGVATLRWDMLNQNGTTVCASRLLILMARAA